MDKTQLIQKCNYEIGVKYPSGFGNSINKALLPSFWRRWCWSEDPPLTWGHAVELCCWLGNCSAGRYKDAKLLNVSSQWIVTGDDRLNVSQTADWLVLEFIAIKTRGGRKTRKKKWWKSDPQKLNFQKTGLSGIKKTNKKKLTRYMERSILRELCSWSRSLTKRSLWKRQKPSSFTHIFALVHRTGETERERGATGASLSGMQKTVASLLKLASAKPYTGVHARISQWDQLVLRVSLRDTWTRERTSMCLKATWAAASGAPIVYFCPQTQKWR